jgi:hypothetical protein
MYKQEAQTVCEWKEGGARNMRRTGARMDIHGSVGQPRDVCCYLCCCYRHVNHSTEESMRREDLPIITLFRIKI